MLRPSGLTASDAGVSIATGVQSLPLTGSSAQPAAPGSCVSAPVDALRRKIAIDCADETAYRFRPSGLIARFETEPRSCAGEQPVSPGSSATQPAARSAPVAGSRPKTAIASSPLPAT
jgi:hypothetical protein